MIFDHFIEIHRLMKAKNWTREYAERYLRVLNMDEDEFEKEFGEDFDPCYYADKSQEIIFTIPEGCRACGGPYPKCKTSCKLFDD